MKTFDVLHFVADNAGLSIFEAIEKAYNMGVSEQEAVIDKIRTEIEQVAARQFQIAMGVADLNERYTHIQMENAYRHSLNVIDKYRAESEKV